MSHWCHKNHILSQLKYHLFDFEKISLNVKSLWLFPRFLTYETAEQKSDGLFNLVIYLGLIDDGWLKACVPLIFKVVQSQNWKIFAATGWIMLEGQSTLWVEPLFPAIYDILVKPLNIRGERLFVGNWWNFLEDEIPRNCHLTIVVFLSFSKFVKVKISKY